MADLTLEQKERNAQFLWTGFIVMFFVIQAVIWTIAIAFTANDQSHAVVANYDERALNWDNEKAARLASARLGWQSELSVASQGDIRKIHVVQFKLKEMDGTPISDARIQLTAFHRGQAGVPQQLEFVSKGNGIYKSRVRIGKSGYWQFSGKAIRDSKVFIVEEKLLLKGGA